MKTILYSIVLFPIFLTAPLFGQASNPLSEKEAVALAEQFVRDNGYTECPPDTSKIRPESLAFLAGKRSLEEVLTERHNTLLDGASHSFYFKDSDSLKGWLVLFKYRDESNNYRVVRISEVDGSIIMMHTDMVVETKR